ncbi:MAG: hypothetical protein AAGA56_04920 [Myxococcota bacterium]
MSAFDRLLRNLFDGEGIESIFLLNDFGERLAGIGPLGGALLDDASGDLTFALEAANDIGSDGTIVLRYRDFSLRLIRGHCYTLGLVATANARRETLALAERIGRRTLDRVAPEQFMATHEAYDPRSTMPSISTPTLGSPGSPTGLPGSSHGRSSPTASTRRPPQRVPSSAPASSHYRSASSSRRPQPSSSPWAQRARRKKRGGGGIWGD